jgi:hypothetical protein
MPAGNRSSDLEAWSYCARAHGQETMKIFEPRSMMQEHLHFIKRASVEEEKNSWTAPAHHIFEFTLKRLLRRRLNERIHMKRTCIVI